MTTCTRLRVLTFGSVLAAASPTASGTGPMAATVQIAIVLDVPAAFPARQLGAMTDETASIWRPYNVRISWLPRDLALGIGPEDVRIVVRMAARKPASHDGSVASNGRPDVIGVIQFIDGIPDGVITLSPEAIETVIQPIGWNGRPVGAWPIALQEDLAGRALGRALAHELGHYLLAERNHSRAGLMRPLFKGRDLVEANRRRFRLEPRDLVALGPRIARLALAGTQ